MATIMLISLRQPKYDGLLYPLSWIVLFVVNVTSCIFAICFSGVLVSQSLCCLSFFDLRLLLTPMVSSNFFRDVRVSQSFVFYVIFCWSLFVLFLLAIVLSVLQFTASACPYGIFKLCLGTFVFLNLCFLCNILLIIVCAFSFGNCVVCPSSIYGF